jgi:hypothetical protein
MPSGRYWPSLFALSMGWLCLGTFLTCLTYNIPAVFGSPWVGIALGIYNITVGTVTLVHSLQERAHV